MTTFNERTIKNAWQHCKEAGCCGSCEDYENLVGFFYKPDFTIALRPPVAGQVDEIHQEIFWHTFLTVRFIEIGDLDSVLTVSLAESLYETGHQIDSSLGGVWCFPDHSLKQHIRQVFRDSNVPDIIVDNLLKCISLATGYLALGVENTKNKMCPLLERWKSGNLPIGFSTKNDLLILCGR